MMHRIRTVVAVAATLTVSLASLAARQPVQSADEQEIRRVVTAYYFEGGRAGDSSRVRQAFDMARAHMFYVQADTLVDVPIPEYVRRIGAGRERPDFRPDGNSRRIVMVDVSGSAAVAKLEIQTPTVVLADYMSLLRVGGRWQIMNKIFDRRAAA
jgi:hypothetical protein